MQSSTPRGLRLRRATKPPASPAVAPAATGQCRISRRGALTRHHTDVGDDLVPSARHGKWTGFLKMAHRARTALTYAIACRTTGRAGGFVMISAVQNAVGHLVIIGSPLRHKAAGYAGGGPCCHAPMRDSRYGILTRRRADVDDDCGRSPRRTDEL